MKKLAVAFLGMIMLSLFTISEASAQTRTYWYYPSSNVYYDIAAKQYVFYNAGTWSNAGTLPSGIVIEKEAPRVTVYHAGNDVWADNAGHVMKYKNYKGKQDKADKKLEKAEKKLEKAEKKSDN
ncbi:MAG: hypothetical protein ABIY51_04230 [Ferruginibacter sp.]